MRNQRARRLIRAYLRDTRVLIRQFRHTILLFVILLCVGAIVLRLASLQASFMTWGEAFFVTLHLMFFETITEYPSHPAAQWVFFVWPILGGILVVNGAVRFGTALFDRQQRREAWQVAVASTYNHHIVVCGLGKVGYRVALQLLKMQHEVVGVDLDPDAVFLERLRDHQVPILVGNARDHEILEKAGVGSASAVIGCTENDLTNLEIALEAREINPTIRVVIRMFDQQLAERVRRGFDIQTAFSTSALAAPALAAAATRAAVEHSFYVDDVLLVVSRITVAAGSPLSGMSVGEIEKELDLSIILHRGTSAMDLHPAPSLFLQEGEQIVVFATLEALACLNRMNLAEEECVPEGRGPRAWIDRLRGEKTGP